MSGSGGKTEEWKPKANPWLIAVTVTLAAFMEVLDTTIVNVALPHIAGALGSSYDDASWTLTSYLVSNGIVLTISSWFAKLLGRKTYFLICIVGFTLSSLACGLSNSLGMLIVFRLFQGFFGGGMQPNQQSIILDTFPPAQRGAAFGLTAMATVVAPVLGPMLGGYLTDNFSWRWIFFVNIPFGLVAFFGVTALVEDPPWVRKQREPIDIVGISLITLGLGCLEVMCDRGEDDDWFGSTFICWMAALAVIGIVGAIIWLLKAKNPLFKLTVFKDRNFATGTFLIAMVGALLYSSAIVVPQFAQQVLGYTATLSGLVLAPGGVAVLIMIPLVGRITKALPLRVVIGFGFFFMGFSMFLAAHLIPTTDFRHLVFYRVMQTGALAFLFVPISTVTYSTLPRELNSDASAMFSMARNYVGSLAISVATAGITMLSQARQTYLANQMSPYRENYQNYLSSVHKTAMDYGMTSSGATQYATYQLYQTFRNQVSMLAYNEMFMLIGIGAFCTVPICFLLSPMKAGGGAKGGGH